MLQKFLLIATFLSTIVVMSCTPTKNISNKEDIPTVMKLSPQGGVNLNHKAITEPQDFLGGLIVVAEDPDSNAIIHYTNADAIKIEEGSLSVDFFKEDDFLSSIQSQEQPKENLNLRKITINHGRVSISTSKREGLSKVTYTVLVGDRSVTFKEGEMHFLVNKTMAEYTVHKGEATLTTPDAQSGVNVGEGQTVTWRLAE